MSIKVRTPYGDTGDTYMSGWGSIYGDTMSPLLFMFCIEPLLRWLNADKKGYTRGLSGVRTSAPAFADDLALLTGSVADMCTQLDNCRSNPSISGP